MSGNGKDKISGYVKRIIDAVLDGASANAPKQIVKNVGDILMEFGSHTEQGVVISTWEDIDNIGSKLSAVLDCPVHLDGYHPQILLCKHGFFYNIDAIKKMDETGWKELRRSHDHTLFP